MRRVMVVGILVVMGVCAGIFGDEGAKVGKLPFTVSKETTGIILPLRADGTVDYVAALNERYSKGVTKENNLIVAWLKVTGTGPGAIGQAGKEKYLQMCGGELSEGIAWDDYGGYVRRHGADLPEQARREADEMAAAGGLWKAEDFPELAAYLKESKALLDAARGAFGRGRYWSPVVVPDGRLTPDVPLPWLGRMRSAATDLCARSTLRAGAGDFAGFMADAMAAKGVARRLGSGATQIERLVGIAIDGMANRAIGAAAGRGDFTAEQYGKLHQALENAGPMPDIVETVDIFDRWTLLDMTAEIAMKGSAQAGDGSTPIGGGIAREKVDWDVVLKGLNGEVDEVLTALKKPRLEGMDAALAKINDKYAARGKGTVVSLKWEEGETPKAYAQRVVTQCAATLVLLQMVPGYGMAERLRREAAMQDEMLAVVLAAAEFRLKSGAWPRELGELVPGNLEKLPRDMYSEHKAVRCVVTDKGVRVYSVGKNGVDDGGVRDLEHRKDDLVVGVK